MRVEIIGDLVRKGSWKAPILVKSLESIKSPKRSDSQIKMIPLTKFLKEQYDIDKYDENYLEPMQYFPIGDMSEILNPKVDATDVVPHKGDRLSGYWAFRGKSVLVKDASLTSHEEVILRIKHAVLKEEKALERIEKQVDAFERMHELSNSRRSRIPEYVRLFVWQRDEGKCVKCGRERELEFDHIIPISKGGSNTENNIQILCRNCNRAKSNHI